MAEETLQESFSGATKGLGATIGFLLLMFGGEMMIEKQEPRTVLGAGLCGLGILFFYLGWAGRAIRKRLPVARLNEIAADPRWWFASILTFVIAITIWRVTEMTFLKNDVGETQGTHIQKQSASASSSDNKGNLFSIGPPSAGRVVVGGPYLPEEIMGMIQVVGKLSDIMHFDIKPTYDAAKSSIGSWAQQVQSEGVSAFVKTLSDDANTLDKASNNIDHILSANARYDSEIRLTVHDRDPGPFVRELRFFASDLSSTADSTPQVREAVLKSDLTRLQQAISVYDNWVYAATDNADYKIQRLRAYKPPG